MISSHYKIAFLKILFKYFYFFELQHTVFISYAEAEYISKNIDTYKSNLGRVAYEL